MYIYGLRGVVRKARCWMGRSIGIPSGTRFGLGPSVVLRVPPSSCPGLPSEGPGSGVRGRFGAGRASEPRGAHFPTDFSTRHKMATPAATRALERADSTTRTTAVFSLQDQVRPRAPRGPPQRPPVFVSERAIPTRTRDPDAALNRGLIRRSSSREALDALIDSTRPLLSPLLSPLLCALIDALGRLRACCRSARWIRCWRRCAGSTST